MRRSLILSSSCIRGYSVASRATFSCKDVSNFLSFPLTTSSDYSHTLILIVIILYFMFEVYATDSLLDLQLQCTISSRKLHPSDLSTAIKWFVCHIKSNPGLSLKPFSSVRVPVPSPSISVLAESHCFPSYYCRRACILEAWPGSPSLSGFAKTLDLPLSRDRQTQEFPTYPNFQL